MSTIYSPCTSPGDTFRAAFLLQALYAYQSQGTPLASVQQLLDGVQSVTPSFAAGTTPAWLLVDQGDQLVVVIAGTPSTGSAQAQLASASSPLVNTGNWSTGDVHLRDARSISKTIDQVSRNRSPRVVLIGHSYGGALAEIAGGLLLDTRADLAVSVTTMGAPRSGNSALAGRLSQLSLLRLMTAEDPIPRFPPRWYEAPFAALASGGLTVAAWSQWVQPGGGLVLASDGTATRAALPPLAAPVADSDLLGWAVGARGDLSQVHSIGEYARRIALYIQAQPIPAPPWPGSRSAEAAAPITVTDATTWVASGGQTVPQSLLGGSSVSGYIPPQYRAKWKSSPPFFWVTWMGVTISNHVSKSSARTHAKYVNKWLRVMQTAKTVPQSQLLQALTAYLAVASQASQGFIPPLIVT